MPRIIRKWVSCHGQLPGALTLPPTMVYCGSSMPRILATDVAHPLISPLLHSLHTPSSLATPPHLPVSIWNPAVPPLRLIIILLSALHLSLAHSSRSYILSFSSCLRTCVQTCMCMCVSAYSFSCGSTWHAAGLMGIPLGGNTLMTKYRHDTIKLIPELEKDSGCDTGV